MDKKDFVKRNIRRAKSTPRKNKGVVKPKFKNELMLLDNPAFQQIAIEKLLQNQASQDLLIKKLKPFNQKKRKKSIKRPLKRANRQEYSGTKDPFQDVQQKQDLDGEKLLNGDTQKNQYLINQFFRTNTEQRPTSASLRKPLTRSTSQSIENMKEDSKPLARRNNLSTNRRKNSQKLSSSRSKLSLNYRSNTTDLQITSKADHLLLLQEGVNTIFKLLQRKIKQSAIKRYTNERQRVEYKELCGLIVKNDGIRIPLDSISKGKVELCSEILTDLTLVAHISIFSDDGNPEDIEEFDHYLDKRRMKVAILPRDKRVKRTPEIMMKRKPLSILPKYNKGLISGLAPNLVNNKRLLKFQICGIHFGKDSWKQVFKYIGESGTIQTIAINKCIMTQEILESLEKAISRCDTCQTVDLRDNNLTDDFGGLVVRLIQAQTEKRDDLIWAYGLRNEFPNHIDKVGMKSIILRRNQLGKSFMKKLKKWVVYDEYLRHIDLCYNKIEPECLKTFISKLQHNQSLLCIELRGNYGFTQEAQSMTAHLLLRNIDHCQQKGVIIEPEWINKDVFDIKIPKNIGQKIVDTSDILNNSFNFDDKTNLYGTFDPKKQLGLNRGNHKSSTKKLKLKQKRSDGGSSPKTSRRTQKRKVNKSNILFNKNGTQKIVIDPLLSKE
ncbi:unnamed protein product [Moneuplotes crassus]|uniref:Leucine Rich Repeat family protein n=1 Tax=Euplotes crassus TaxID=5936 RepID=A0AAD2DAE1_EUPCR|nr:unnamed protein product [Moneuplotes crassus]